MTMDLGKAYTNKTVPKPAVAQSERIIPDNEIIARPLGMPDFINQKPKNKNMCFYWGNRAVGDKESKMRINDLQAKGFKFAIPSDIEGWDADPEKSTVPDALIMNNRIIHGDLILMIIPREQYVGALKYNAQSALNRVRKPGIVTDQDGKEQSILNSLASSSKGKIRPFVPSADEAAQITGASADPAKEI